MLLGIAWCVVKLRRCDGGGGLVDERLNNEVRVCSTNQDPGMPPHQFFLYEVVTSLFCREKNERGYLMSFGMQLCFQFG